MATEPMEGGRPVTTEDIANALADLLAKRRTGGSVYMNGSHHPLPTEIRDASRFVDAHVAPLAAERAKVVTLEERLHACARQSEHRRERLAAERAKVAELEAAHRMAVDRDFYLTIYREREEAEAKVAEAVALIDSPLIAHFPLRELREWADAHRETH